MGGGGRDLNLGFVKRVFGGGISTRNWEREACMYYEGVVVVHALVFLGRGRLAAVDMRCHQGIVRVGAD